MQFIPFCQDWSEASWDTRPEAEQEAHVADELRRLEADGEPVLRAVLACQEDWPQFLALRLLRDGVDSAGNPVVDLPQVYLRLVHPDAVPYTNPQSGEIESGCALPPPRDPGGHPLPPAKAGKVLVAKIGNLGGNLDPSRDAAAARPFGGDKRNANGKSGRPLYVTKEVTREAKAFSMRDAIIILRQWGYGIGDTAYRSPRQQALQGAPTRGQCMWLVEEVSPEEAQKDMLRKQVAGKSKGESVAKGAE